MVTDVDTDGDSRAQTSWLAPCECPAEFRRALRVAVRASLTY